MPEKTGLNWRNAFSMSDAGRAFWDPNFTCSYHGKHFLCPGETSRQLVRRSSDHVPPTIDRQRGRWDARRRR